MTATIKTGLVWTAWDEADLFLLPTSNQRRNEVLSDSTLVWREAEILFPGIRKKLGEAVESAHEADRRFLVSPRWPEKKVGLFRVSMTNGRLNRTLLSATAADLTKWIERHSGARVVMAAPRLLDGRLLSRMMQALVQALPPTVELWDLEKYRPQRVGERVVCINPDCCMLPVSMTIVPYHSYSEDEGRVFLEDGGWYSCGRCIRPVGFIDPTLPYYQAKNRLPVKVEEVEAIRNSLPPLAAAFFDNAIRRRRFVESEGFIVEREPRLGGYQ